jgi:hypothetical protein
MFQNVFISSISTNQVSSGTTWNSTFHGPHVTLSNGNLTATTENFDDWSKVVGSIFQSIGLRYFEATPTYGPSYYSDGQHEFGVGTEAFDATNTTNEGGSDTTSWVLVDSVFRVQTNGAFITPSGTGIIPGDTFKAAINFSTGKGWLGSVADGWAGGGDPAAGTTPSFTFTPNTALAPVDVFFGSPGVPVSITLNCGGSAFAGAIPVGFTAWNA